MAATHATTADNTVTDDEAAREKSSPAPPSPPPNLPTTDAEIITFTPADPADPRNWPRRQKLLTVLNISVLAGVGQMSSTMLAPSVVSIMAEFHTASEDLAVFVVSVLLLGVAVGLLTTSGLSEVYGRVPVFYASNVLFVVFAVATALAGSLGQLIAFRFLLGVAAAAPSAVGGGVIGDMFVAEERGRATSVYAFGMLVGPLVGPIAGGYLTEAKGWRWVNWIIAILGGAMLLITFAVLRETFRPLVLERKVKRLRKETGNPNLESAMKHPHSGSKALVQSLIRPVRLMLFSPVVLLPTLGLGIMFGLFFLMISTMATVFQLQYGFSVGSSGLAYLGFSIGLMGGIIVFAVTSDRAYKALAKPKPEIRLAPIGIGAPLACAGLLIYGWGIEKGVHWMLPIVGSAVFSLSMIAFVMPVTTYLIEVFREYAAAPTGVSAFMRSLLGGVLPLCASRLYKNLGLGWGNTLLAFIALAFAPLPWQFYRNGERLRLRFPPKEY